MPRPSDRESSEASYLAPYRRAVERHGASFEATLWRSREWQRVRFDVIADMVDLTGRVVLDAGSGQGAFAQRLLERGVEYGRFIGLDGLPELVGQSQALGLPEAEFHVCDFAGEENAFERYAPAGGAWTGIDVIVFSGSLNTFDETAARVVLERAWRACREAVVFNFLSDRHGRTDAPEETDPARRFDTVGMVDWALRMTPRVRFRQDYLGGHDATVGMFKGA